MAKKVSPGVTLPPRNIFVGYGAASEAEISRIRTSRPRVSSNKRRRRSRTTLGKLPDSQALRCMASTWLPYVSPVTGDSQLGRSCKGCQIAMETNICDRNFSRRERVYSRDGFLDHFRDYEEVKELWLSSEGGTVTVAEPEWTRLGGLRSG